MLLHNPNHLKRKSILDNWYIVMQINELGSLYTWRKSPADILNRELGGNEAVLTSGNWTACNWSSFVTLLQKFNIHG